MTPMLDRDAVMRQLWAYLDGELTAEREEAIRANLSLCARCNPHRGILGHMIDTRTPEEVG